MAVTLLRDGKIVAVRGLGGYHLLVDATRQDAVLRLRKRKRRPAKPIVVLVGSLTAAGQLAQLSPMESAALSGPARPIVILQSNTPTVLAPAVSPQLNTVGLMLPSTPLLAELLDAIGLPLAVSGGNVEGHPLEHEVAHAEKHLTDVADAWLHHDETINCPMPDSVVRIIAGRWTTLRLGRGLAPLPLALEPIPPALAVGDGAGSGLAWSDGTISLLGPSPTGGRSGPAAHSFARQIEAWQRLCDTRPDLVVHDLYRGRIASRWAKQQHLPSVAVQHHRAHLAAGMLEHGWLDQPVLGVAWDDGGYGHDGTLWGGEFLRCTATHCERLACIRPLPLPGGRCAVLQPWRTALAACHQVGIADEMVPRIGVSAPVFQEAVTRLNSPRLAPLTSSVTCLMDAAAVLILGITRSDYTGEATMRLESIADRDAEGAYDMTLVDGDVAELDWRTMFRQLAVDIRHGLHPGVMAMRLHRGLAEGIATVCGLRPGLPVILSGDAFENRLLTELVVETMRHHTQPLGLAGSIPPGNAGIAAGQLVVAAASASS